MRYLKMISPSILSQSTYILDNFRLCTGGNILEWKKRRGKISEKQVARIMYEILSAVSYFHARRVMHRDIKPENILMLDNSSKSSVRIIDFGISTVFTKGDVLDKCIGTLLYAAPELLLGSYDEKVDIWSIGATCYVLISGIPPFSGETSKALVKSILQGEIDLSVLDTLGTLGKGFITQALTILPGMRPTAEELLNNKWFGVVQEDIYFKQKKWIDKMNEFRVNDAFGHAILSYIIAQTIEEVDNEIIEVFHSLDIEKNGRISKGDLISVCENIYPSLNSNQIKSMAAKLIKNADTDNSGTIEYSEFLVSLTSKSDLQQTNHLKKAFRLLDIDGDGQISISELKTALSGLNLPSSFFESAMEKIDLDKSASVS